jgi:hypothetical protein
MIKGKNPLAVRLVRHMDTDYVHGLTVVISERKPAGQRAVKASNGRVTDPRGPPTFPATFGGSHGSISIRHQNTWRLQVKAEGEKKYVSPVCITIDTNDAVKGQQSRDFRTWHDTTGLHMLEAAFVEYKAGIVHLSSSDGTLLEIPEGNLAQEDLTYLESQGVSKTAHSTKRPGIVRRMLARLPWVK